MNNNALKISMISLVKVLRELLANLEEEHHSILVQNPSVFHSIMENRHSLMNSIHDCRQVMMKEIDILKSKHPESLQHEEEKEKLMNLTQWVGDDNVELLTLRDQILALMEETEKQNVRNNFLLGNQSGEKENYSHQYKPVKRRIPPKRNPVQQKKPSLTTLEEK